MCPPSSPHTRVIVKLRQIKYPFIFPLCFFFISLLRVKPKMTSRALCRAAAWPEGNCLALPLFFFLFFSFILFIPLPFIFAEMRRSFARKELSKKMGNRFPRDWHLRICVLFLYKQSEPSPILSDNLICKATEWKPFAAA